MLKFVRAIVGVFAIAVATAGVAEASPIQSITMTGTTGYGYDGSGQFGVSGGDLGGKSYTLVVSYDPTALKNDNCGVGSNNSCGWNYGGSGITETLTIGSITKSYTMTGGTIQYCACSGKDSIFINASLGGEQFGLNFSANSSLFSNQINVNNPLLLNNVTNLAVTSTNFGTSGLGGNASGNGGNTGVGFNPTSITTNLTTTAVPEPLTLSLFGAGLFGAGALRRRRNKKKA